MAEHLTAKQVEQYKNRMLPVTELCAVSAHLVACEECSDLLRADDETEAAYQFLHAEVAAARLEESPHLTPEEMFVAAGSKVHWADREVFETHLEGCRRCSALVSHLKSRQATVSDGRRVLAETAPDRTAIPGLFSNRVYRSLMQAAAVVLLAAGAAWIATRPVRLELERLRSQIAESTETNARLEAQLGSLEALQAEVVRLKEENELLISEWSGKAPGERSGIDGFRLNGSLILNDGGRRLAIESDGQMSGTTLPRSYRRLVERAFVAGQLQMPGRDSDLLPKVPTIMSNEPEKAPFALVAPRATVVESDRPTLRWHPLSGADGYVVAVRHLTLKRVITSPSLQQTEWVVPEALERGAVYSWQVRAIKNGSEFLSPSGSEPEWRFRVLNSAAVAAVAQARTKYGRSHILLAVIYASNGLLDEAEHELRLLEEANPKSEIIKRLLAGLNAARQR